ncbi:hypothetical protein HYH03_003693 [Edaphochlamys debaryana]|uniref:Peptidase M11 gametolysin domain-containing protein n=1 Tax=Edaphochlamys debaryana TaxID=47281 RepID=A0A835Y8W3_9CHLO|nr:hypothetical protein HYH03_003693 [Edaphochlamys debaryana]|eukprot:KAG2498435.1 hypothetical protein HYH03_003693 [Edaphochlamys debaryana]
MGESETEWNLIDSRGKTIHSYGKGKSPPAKDRNGNPLKVGDYVVSECTYDTVTQQCSSLTSADYTLLNSPSPPVATGVVQKVLILIANNPTCLPNPLDPGVTIDQVRAKYFGADGTGTAQGCVARSVEDCSYGNIKMDPVNSKIDMVTPVCWNTSICEGYYTIDGAMRNAAAAAGIDLTKYDHYHWIVRGWNCGWSGAAQTPGTVVWMQPWGLDTVALYQEPVHHYYRWHGYGATATSGGASVEYKDPTTFMGNGWGCPSAPELATMGWASPAVGAGNLNRDTVAAGPGFTGPFNLPATYLTGAGAYVRMRPDWLPNYYLSDGVTINTVQPTRNLYFAVRVGLEADYRTAGALHDRSLNVHDVQADRDVDPLAVKMSNNRMCNFTAYFQPNSRNTLARYNLVVYTGSFIGDKQSILPTYFCRYSASDAECPALATVIGGVIGGVTPTTSPPVAASTKPPAASPPPPPPPPPRMPSPPPPPPPSPRPPSPSPPPPSPPPSPRPPSPKPPSPAPPRPPPPPPCVATGKNKCPAKPSKDAPRLPPMPGNPMRPDRPPQKPTRPPRSPPKPPKAPKAPKKPRGRKPKRNGRGGKKNRSPSPSPSP